MAVFAEVDLTFYCCVLSTMNLLISGAFVQVH